MRLPSFAFWLMMPATLGLLQPDLAQAAGPMLGNNAVLVRDVALSDDASLAGTVNDRQGRPVPGAEVYLLQAGNVVARASTTIDGRFRVLRLQGGIYEVATAGGSGIYRVWLRNAAPPSAADSVVVVADNGIVRGQGPRTGFFRSDAFLISAAVAGAVAIPIFISVARRDQPPGS